jgi:membrane-bound lytic murein transglycosylase D
MKFKIFTTATLMAAFIFGGIATEASAQSKKDLQEEINRLRDSLGLLNRQVDTLKEENTRFRLEFEAVEESEDSSFFMQDEIAPEEYTTEVTDSLMDIWYTHQMAINAQDEFYDMDSVRFASNVPDEVYIERLKKMNSFIQIPYNDIVRNYIIMYSEKMHKRMPYMLGLCKYYMPIFEETFDKYELPVELKAMAIIESAMNPRAESRVGAKGMWQFMYNIAKSYGLHVDSFVDERMDPVKSCEAAALYLEDAYNMFGDWNLAIASYNCGAGNVQKAIKRAGSRKFWDIWPYLPRETRSYVPAFVGALYTLEFYKEHGIKPESMVMPAAVDTIVIKKQLHLKQVSEITGAPIEELKNLNPQYRHEIIPGHEREYILRIPYQYTGSFIENEDTIYKHKASIYFDPVAIKKIKDGGDGVRIIHKVKNGEYLGRIASKYHVSVAKIKKWNNLKNDNIRVGQSLVIYRGGSGPSAAQTSSSKSSSSKNSSSGSSKSSSSGNTKITYTVKKGDALGKIAEAHGVGLSKIKEWNGLKNDNIKVGQKLIIYTSSKSSSSSVSAAKGHTTYTVKSGDTFYSIAKNYPGVSAQNIMDYNGIESSKIRAGMTIKIPQY